MDTSLVNGISDHDSSDDDVPLSKLLKKPQNDDKQLHGSTGSLTLSSNNNSGKDKSGLNDTSDDEPLEQLTKASLSAKEPDNHENKSGSTSGMSNKKTDLSGHGSSDDDDDDDDDVPLIKFMQKQKDERQQHEKTKGPTVTSKAALAKHDVSDVKKDGSSDDEPLIKKSKVSSKAAKQTRLLSTKRLADTDRKESLEDDVSSDDEPLSELAKKLKLQHQTRPPVTPPRNASLVKRCKRKVPRKKVQSLESSSDSSDDEPLIKLKKTTKNLSEETVSTNGRKTKPNTKDQLPKDPSSSGGSSDDDVPLVNLIGKQDKPAGKDTEKTKTPVSRTSKAARKRRELSDESSDDEPSINREKKTLRDTTTPSTKATTSKKKTAAPANKQPGKAPVARKNTGSDTPSEGSSSNSSDDEALIKTVKNPQVRKILRVILERCSVEELGAAGCLNKTSTVDEEMMEADSDLPEESPEKTVPEEA